MIKCGTFLFVVSMVMLSLSQQAHAVCSSPAGAEGAIWYDTTPKKVKYCDDTNWIELEVTSSGNYVLPDGTVPMTDTFLLATGALGTGGISFDGDTDTGIFQAAADEIGFSTAGSEVVRIDAAGNVGIGTNNPQERLEVSGGSTILGSHDGADFLYLNRHSAGSPYAYITPGDSDRDVGVGMKLQYRNAVGSQADAITIDSGFGNVGIGTGSPGASLEVENASSGVELTRIESTVADAATDTTLLNLVATDDGDTNTIFLAARDNTNDLKLEIYPEVADRVWVNFQENIPHYIAKQHDFLYTGIAGDLATQPYAFKFDQSAANREITGDDEQQAVMLIRGEYLQTGTAAADALYVNPTVTSLGDGTSGAGNNLLRLANSGTDHFFVTMGGQVGVGVQPANEKLEIEGGIAFKEITAPTTDVATYHKLYVDAADNKLKFRDEGGTVTDLLAGGSGDFLADGTVPMTDTLLLGQGGLGTGGISFNGDTDMGMFRNGADDLHLSAGFSTLYVNSTGAGTFDNSFTMNYGQAAVYSSSSGTLDKPGGAVMQVRDASNSTDGIFAGINFMASNAGPTDQNAYIGAVSNTGAGQYTPDIVIGHSTGDATYSEVMRIDASGNVGIGTSSPNDELHVRSVDAGTTVDILIQNDMVAGDAALELSEQSGGVKIIYDGGENSLRFTDSGNNTRYRFDRDTGSFFEMIASGTNDHSIRFDTGGANAKWIVGRDDSNSDAFVISSDTDTPGTNDRLVIETGGDVGIGTTSPTNKLHVNGTGTTLPVRISTDASASQLQFSNSGTGTMPTIGSEGDDLILTSNGTTRMELTSDGAIEVPEISSAPAVSATGKGRIYFDDTDNKFKVSENGGAYVDLLSGGGGALNDLSDATYNSTAGSIYIGDGGTGGSETNGATNNIAIGYSVLDNLSTGDANTVIGYDAMASSDSSRNTAMGQYVMYENTSGNSNVAIGAQALDHNNTGSNNVAIGDSAGYGNATPSAKNNNVFIGYDSGVNVTTSDDNIMIGYQSGNSITTGDGNIIIGYDVDLAAADSNKMTIGNLIFADGGFGTGTTAGTGRIGIGLSPANEKLEIEGGIAFKEITAPTSDVATYHKLYVDAADNKLKFRDEGGTVTDLLSSGGLSAGDTLIGADGSDASPGIRFNGDTDTGFFLNGNNSVGVTVGGSEIASFDGTGLHFSDTGAGYSEVITNAGTVSSQFGTDSTKGAVGTATNHPFVFNTNDTERMRIDTSGNVGIGISSPTTKLHVNSSGANGMLISGDNGTGDFHSIRIIGNHATHPVLLSDAGRIIAPFNRHLTFELTGNSASDRFAFLVDPDNAGGADFEAFTIENSGDVGIGTSTPAFKFDVNGIANSTRVAIDGTTCLDVVSDQIFHDTDCDGTKDAGEEFIDSTGGGGGDFLANGSVAMTGALRQADGAVGTPSYTFTDDTDTGMWSESANELNFSAGGSKQISIVSGAITFHDSFEIFSFDNTVYAATSSSQSFPDAAYTYIENTSSTNGGMAAINLEPRRSGGVKQNAYIGAVSNSSGNTPDIVIGQQTGATAYDERLRIDSSGQVGIGITVPTEKLHIENGSVLVKNANGTYVKLSGGLASGQKGLQIIYDNTDDEGSIQAVHQGTANKDLVLNQNGGNVGINMSNPSVSLDVTGDIEYTGTITDVSDRRLKDNIEPLENGLEKINKVPVYSFTMINDPEQKTEFGVIAQELLKEIPDLVTIIDPDNDYMGVNYVGLIPWSIAAIQELDQKVDRQAASIDQKVSNLNNEVAELKTENKELKSRLDRLEQQNRELASVLERLLEKESEKSDTK